MSGSFARGRIVRSRGLLFLALLFAIGAPSAWSQDAPKADRFTVALWPEYDRPAVLVSYRVELSPEVTLPAQVDLPIPANVGVPHAVAKRGVDGTLYLAPATRVVDGEWAVMQVTTDRPYLHLEYYAPFSTSADLRTFTFQWRGGMEIANFSYEVLPPASAVNLAVTPPPTGQAMSDLGVPLQIGELGTHAAAQQETIVITYSNPNGRLTVTPAPPSPAASPPSLVSSSDELPAEESNATQLMVIVLVTAAAVLVGFWLVRRNRGPGGS